MAQRGQLLRPQGHIGCWRADKGLHNLAGFTCTDFRPDSAALRARSYPFTTKYRRPIAGI